jgi:hypothetical protein
VLPTGQSFRGGQFRHVTHGLEDDDLSNLVQEARRRDNPEGVDLAAVLVAGGSMESRVFHERDLASS